MIYLDDLDPEQMTDEQKAELKKMFDEDPYHFYNLWRDPDAAQRYFEGDDFQTTPASEVYLKLGALKMAGAPQGVIDTWADILKTRGRPTEDVSEIPPKTKPIAEKLEQIETLCRHINEDLNYIVDNVTPAQDDWPDEIPFAKKWHQVMNIAVGHPKVEEYHKGIAKHYKATDASSAHFGVEILEIQLGDDSVDIDLEDCFDIDLLDDNSPHKDAIRPNSVHIEQRDDHVILYFRYYGCYE